MTKIELINRANARSVLCRQIVQRRRRVRHLRDHITNSLARRFAWLAAQLRAEWVGRR